MKNRKIVAWGTLLIMLSGLLPANILANDQKPLSTAPDSGILGVEVKHNIIQVPNQNQIDITPNVTATWKSPPANDSTGQGADYDKDGPEYYRFELTDILNTGSAVLSSEVYKTGAPNTELADTIQTYMRAQTDLVNGKLYKLRVIPYHTHRVPDGQGGTRLVEIGPSAGMAQPERYFATDFNTKVRDSGGKLEISWEYIPGATYRIVYASGNKTEKSQMVTAAGNATEGTSIKEMADAEARTHLVQDGGQKVRYVVPDSRPGQIYSAYVELVDVQNARVPRTNIYKNTTSPKIAQVTTSVVLNVTNISKDKIRLDWNLGDWLAVDTQLRLETTTIYQKLKSQSGFTNVGTIQNDGSDTGYYIMTEPKEEAEYYVIFTAVYTDTSGRLPITMQTRTVPYVPYELRIKPLPPQVPKPYNQKSAEDDIKNYLVNGDDIDSASERLIDNTFHVKGINPINLQFIWGAPKKVNSNAIDYDIVYDIWVGEDQTQIRDIRLIPLEQNVMFDAALREALIFKRDGATVVGYKRILQNYTRLDGTVAPFLPNKTYYIKIVAKKNYGAEIYEESDPTIVTITLDKNGDIFTPPVLAKPPLKLQEVTTQTATMRWLETWAEIMPKQADIYTDPVERFYAEIWNSKIYTQMNSAPYMEAPYARFKKLGAADNEDDIHILRTNADIERVKNIINTNAGTDYFANHFTSRIVTLGSDTRYELKVLPYNDIALRLNGNTNTTTSSMIDIDALGKWLIENESSSTAGWSTINPNAITDSGLAAKEYVVGGLSSNTRYIVMIRAYRILADGTKLMQTFPSYVLCTTLSEHESPEAVPKVPILNFAAKSDTSITVKWLYNQNFDYEIVYSRLQDPNAATVWPFEISNTPGGTNYVSDGAEAQVKITGLTPETTYNIWVRAKQKRGDKVSAWSNPVTAKTDVLGTPTTPTGLGPAAYQSILELGQDFPPIAKDYITVEWVKNSNDIEEAESAELTYSYVVEFADNPEFLDAVVVNTSGAEGGNTQGSYELLAKNMVRFNNLIANRPYYVKVKTVLTFKDTEGQREIVKESDYTKWVRILTKTSTDEYDGGENDNIVIYPESIVQDYTNDIWTLEIVDTAKVISEILKKKDYYYTLTMQRYDNRYDAATRRIKIPKAVIDTLINQRMELKVITNIGTYEIPAKALAVYTNGYEAKDMIHFEFKTILDYKIANILRPYPEKLLKGEQLDINIRGKNRMTTVKKLDGTLRVKIKLDGANEHLYKTLNAYTYNFDTGNWQKENYSINSVSETETNISYASAIAGIYTVYERVSVASPNLSTFAMRELAKKYGINSLGAFYFQNDPVHSNQFTHLLLGIAQSKSQIDLAAPIYTDTRSRAQSAGIYTEGTSGIVNEEQAIAGVVRLYELKTGYKVKPSTVTLNNVSTKYQEAVRKAYAIGLIDSINPKQAVTYSKLCDWLLQVTE